MQKATLRSNLSGRSNSLSNSSDKECRYSGTDHLSSRDCDSVHASVISAAGSLAKCYMFGSSFCSAAGGLKLVEKLRENDIFNQFGWLPGSSVEHHSSQFRGPIHGVAANGLLFVIYLRRVQGETLILTEKTSTQQNCPTRRFGCSRLCNCNQLITGLVKDL